MKENGGEIEQRSSEHNREDRRRIGQGDESNEQGLRDVLDWKRRLREGRRGVGEWLKEGEDCVSAYGGGSVDVPKEHRRLQVAQGCIVREIETVCP
ncbi:inositol 3-alpha-galactosyltransferase [Sarracenia purpurea var. burkii]